MKRLTIIIVAIALSAIVKAQPFQDYEERQRLLNENPALRETYEKFHKENDNGYIPITPKIKSLRTDFERGENIYKAGKTITGLSVIPLGAGITSIILSKYKRQMSVNGRKDTDIAGTVLTSIGAAMNFAGIIMMIRGNRIKMDALHQKNISLGMADNGMGVKITF